MTKIFLLILLLGISGLTAFAQKNILIREVVIKNSRKNKFARHESDYVAKIPLKDIENPLSVCHRFWLA